MSVSAAAATANENMSDHPTSQWMKTMNDLRYCRFCGKSGWSDDLLKYGTRAYAHFQCWLNNKTLNDLAALPSYRREKLDKWWEQKYGPIEED